MTWEHKPNRSPDLNYDDLKTIEWLIKNHGERDIPIFSKNLYIKVRESLAVYEWEKQLQQNSIWNKRAG